MVQSKVIAFAAIVLLCLSSCSGEKVEWICHSMDGHRTGVKSSGSDDVKEKIGSTASGVYYAPNGMEFKDCAAAGVGALMIMLQPGMAELKTVVGRTTEPMISAVPESNLSNWFIDVFASSAERITGRHIDLAITNFGGIRVDFPAGDIIKDDVVSMFPFKNYLTYLRVSGADLRKIFDYMARERMAVLSSSVRFVIDAASREVVSVEINGEPLDDKKMYGLATVDFLLDGGDGFYLARNARECRITNIKVIDIVLPAVYSLTAKGLPVEGHIDGRVTYINE